MEESSTSSVCHSQEETSEKQKCKEVIDKNSRLIMMMKKS